jgi:TIR domain
MIRLFVKITVQLHQVGGVMAYLAPDFDPDVFVSYSHGDCLGDGKSPLKEWTRTLFREILQREIQALHPEFRTLNVWMDDKIDPTALLTAELRDTVSASGVLMIVMSEHYLASSWCHDELEWFRKQIRDRAGDPGRVFVIRAQKTDPSKWPDFLRDERGNPLIGFTFHDPDNGMPLGWPDLRWVDVEFRKAMAGLHTALTKRLRELRERAGQRSRVADAQQSPATATGSRPVYLHALPESEAARADIQLALSSDGIETVTEEPGDGPRLQDMKRESDLRIEAAKRCEALAVVRADKSRRSVVDVLEIGVDERERIAIARGRPIPCAVLDRTGERMPIDVSAYGIDRFDVNKDSWRNEFRQWLAAARAPLTGAPA